MAKTMLMVALAAFAASGAVAQSTATTQDPGKQFHYELKGGKPQPKAGARVVNPDGTWRQETRRGSCTEVKEGLADGTVKTTRTCD